MHPRYTHFAAALPLLALLLAPLAACSPGDEPSAPDQATEAPAAATPAGAGVDLDAVLEQAKGMTEKIRLTMAAARETKIEVIGAEPGPLPGLVDLKLRVTREGRSAIRRVTVTADLKTAVVGEFVSLGSIPRMRVEMENVDLADVPSRGNPEAEVTIVEYSDFQCPFCRAVNPLIEKLQREHEGRIRVVYKHYPLKIHDWAMDASILAECARKQKSEVFWDLHDYYYESAKDISRENILSLTQERVKDQGIAMDAFNKCYLEQEPAEDIQADIDEGKSVGVRGTPAFLINDVFASGALAYDILNAIVLEELGRSQPPGAGETPGESEPANAG